MGPTKKHYRCYKFYIPQTKGYRKANTAKFYPAHCKTPTIEPGDTIRLAAQDLNPAIKQNTKTAPISLHHKHTEALRKLANIFAEAAGETEHALPRVEQTVPRVQNRPTTSTEPTAPSRLKQTRFVHQRVTRRTKPSPELPTIHEESKQNLARAQRRERRAQPVEPPPVHKKRTIREYQQAQEAVKASTPTPVQKSQPNYISQDDEEANHAMKLNGKTEIRASANACGMTPNAVYHLMGHGPTH